MWRIAKVEKFMKGFRKFANLVKIPKVTRIFLAMWKVPVTNMVKIARIKNLTKFYTSWTYLYPKITFYCLWPECNYIHRWFIHPWIMKYSSLTTPIGIPLGGPVQLSKFWLDWGSTLQWRLQRGPSIIFICDRLNDQSQRRLVTSQAKNKLQRRLLHSAWLFIWSHIMQCWNGLVELWKLGP